MLRKVPLSVRWEINKKRVQPQVNGYIKKKREWDISVFASCKKKRSYVCARKKTNVFSLKAGLWVFDGSPKPSSAGSGITCSRKQLVPINEPIP